MDVGVTQAVAKYIHGTLKNSSMGITNLIGPVEKMSLANHPIRGLYFTVVGAPQVLENFLLHLLLIN